MKTCCVMVSALVITVTAAVAAGQTVDQAKLVDLQKLGQEVTKTQSQLDQILADRGVPGLQTKVLELLSNNGEPLATSNAMRDLARAQRSVLESWDRNVTARHFEVLGKIDQLRTGLNGEAAGRAPNGELAVRASRMSGTLDEMAKQLQKMPEGPARQRLKDRFARLLVVQQRTQRASERPGNAAVAKVLAHVEQQLDRYADWVEGMVFDTEIQRIDLVAQVELLEQLADVLQIVALGDGLKTGNGLKLTGTLSNDVIEKLVGQLDQKLGTTTAGSTTKPVMASADVEAEIYRRATHEAAPNREKLAVGSVTTPASQPSRTYLDVLRPQASAANQ